MHTHIKRHKLTQHDETHTYTQHDITHIYTQTLKHTHTITFSHTMIHAFTRITRNDKNNSKHNAIYNKTLRYRQKKTPADMTNTTHTQ